MGINVVMYAVCDEVPTAESLERVRALLLEQEAELELSPVVDEYVRETLAEQGFVGVLLLGLDTYWRYYGPGYERGPCLEIIKAAEAIETLPARVYYGGDGSDYVALFDKAARDKLLEHFNGPHGDNYRKAFKCPTTK